MHSDPYKGRPDAWQHNETINDFLRRLPVTEPETANVGPWLWVSSPNVSRTRQQREGKADVDAFRETGNELLDAFMNRKSKTEAEHEGKAPATITRKMGPYRDQLEEDLLSAAVKTGMFSAFARTERTPIFLWCTELRRHFGARAGR